jgi:hypothetical protein
LSTNKEQEIEFLKEKVKENMISKVKVKAKVAKLFIFRLIRIKSTIKANIDEY